MRILAAALVAASGVAHAVPPAAASDAPELNLRIVHQSTAVGRDGVLRETRYVDRMYRRAGMVWIEREMPAVLRHGHAHDEDGGPHSGHSHADTIAAPLWVTRDADGKGQVTMVLRGQHKLIQVDAANYGNVGYGGSWAGAYWVMDPARLKQMRIVGPANGGIQHLQSERDGATLRVDWDGAGQYPRRIERRDIQGRWTEVTEIKPLPSPPKVFPWQALQGYERGEYSDLLD